PAPAPAPSAAAVEPAFAQPVVAAQPLPAEPPRAPAPAAPASAPAPVHAAGEAHQAPVSADLDGARLVALNMALNGESREQADRYLQENFQLSDRTKLLDEVYAAIE